MALEHDVEALIARVRNLTERVRHLEEMLTGPTIKLEAGGSSIVISPQGIVLELEPKFNDPLSRQFDLTRSKEGVDRYPNGVRGLRPGIWRSRPAAAVPRRSAETPQ